MRRFEFEGARAVEITEVRIKLMEESGERLQAFCSITFDHCFVIRDLKIIGGATGPFVAMPSRRLTAHCPQCGCKNHLKSGYCNQCGIKLKQEHSARDDDGRTKLYADIAHPINQACRDMIQAKVIEAFHLEQERAKQPGYVSSYDDIDDEVAAPRRQHHGPRRDDAHVRRTPPVVPPQQHAGPPQQPSSQPTPTQPLIAPSGETKKVEPPSPEPRAPHTNINAPTTGSQSTSNDPKKGTGFGEGIL
jgi:stage V sporulation protein G